MDQILRFGYGCSMEGFINVLVSYVLYYKHGKVLRVTSLVLTKMHENEKKKNITLNHTNYLFWGAKPWATTESRKKK